MRPRFRALEAPRRGFSFSGGNVVQQAVQVPEESADDFEIEDTTQPEQLSREAAVLTGEAPPSTEEAPEAPETQTPAEPAETPAAQAEPAAPATPPAPQPRTYTEEEVRQLRESARGRIEAERRQAQEAQRQLRDVNREAMVEAALRSEEARLAPTMGADEARAFVRDPSRVNTVRQNYVAQDRLREIEERLTATGIEQEQGAKIELSLRLAREHNIAAEDQELLLSVATPEAMVKMAKRLGTQAAGQAKAVAERRAMVPAETKATSLESGVSGSASPESDDARSERLNMTPSWEWTDADYDYMKRQ